jgi:hypothetical protein
LTAFFVPENAVNVRRVNMAQGESKTSPRRLDAAERQCKALELRKRGCTFETIAEKLEYRSPSGAYKAVKTALLKTLREPADEVRELELTRLDVALNAIWDGIENGNLRVIDRFLKIAERRAKYLGLDAPQQIEIADLRRKAEEIAVRLGISAVDVLGQAEAVAAAAMVGEDY